MPSRPPHIQRLPRQQQRQQKRAADQRAGSARARGYTTQWDAASLAYRQAHPLCLGCQAVGRIEATACVDHVEPHRGDHRRFWDPDNWQPACTWHHSVVKQKLELLFDARRITAADLRLDSGTAIAVTRKLRPFD